MPMFLYAKWLICFIWLPSETVFSYYFLLRASFKLSPTLFKPFELLFPRIIYYFFSNRLFRTVYAFFFFSDPCVSFSLISLIFAVVLRWWAIFQCFFVFTVALNYCCIVNLYRRIDVFFINRLCIIWNKYHLILTNNSHFFLKYFRWLETVQ